MGRFFCWGAAGCAFRPFCSRTAAGSAPGRLLTFASSFGQTFFISLFGTELRAEFDLSDGEFGGLYTIGTVASALCLIAASSLTDRFRARAIAIAVIALYAAICVAMARVDGPVMLAVVIFGLRFCGQGMMSQIAMTAMARWFRGRRGRAVAIAGLGFSFGEAVFPLLAVATMGLVGWRGSWLAAAAFLILIAPVLLRLLATERTPQQWAEQNDAPGHRRAAMDAGRGAAPLAVLAADDRRARPAADRHRAVFPADAAGGGQGLEPGGHCGGLSRLFRPSRW
jgi:MFS family permease